MDRNEILAAVEGRVRAIPGVEDVRFLDPEIKETITRMEIQAEKNGSCGGLMKFVNRGVWEALSREVSFVIVGNAHLLVDNRGLLYMLDEKQQVIGEYVTPEQKEEILAKDPTCHFLSEDFILHPEVEISGEPYFLIDEVRFHFIEDIEGVERVTSGSLSTLSDDLVRTVMGYPGPKKWTHLVGFDIKK